MTKTSPTEKTKEVALRWPKSVAGQFVMFGFVMAT